MVVNSVHVEILNLIQHPTHHESADVGVVSDGHGEAAAVVFVGGVGVGVEGGVPVGAEPRLLRALLASLTPILTKLGLSEQRTDEIQRELSLQ